MAKEVSSLGSRTTEIVEFIPWKRRRFGLLSAGMKGQLWNFGCMALDGACHSHVALLADCFEGWSVELRAGLVYIGGGTVTVHLAGELSYCRRIDLLRTIMTKF